ncbi:MAG: ABC transporter ATP-binding protein [Acidobacteriota bacterium]|nr:ABC transporter ATP-binding protein [Acidobacteriota bacterium]
MRTPSNSSNPLAIRCEGIGKCYPIGSRERYRTLRDTLADFVRSPLRHLSAPSAELWALRGINLEVRRGEVLGIVGRNGSGKSTLLKILSRITKPTEGRAEIHGRMGTLLEVGTGFHPELTGRENIYLYGAILGMAHAEIARKFDEIVEFSECERMLDTAMKHYSSGMYVRLAFAVAAHLETEILLADEVLAVGDAAFQKKCLGKIGDAASRNRTVLFVSHNLLAVESLCSRAICLHGGQIVLEGPTAAVTSRYLQNWMPKFKEVFHPDPGSAPGNDYLRLRRASIHPQYGDQQERLTVRTPLVMEFEYWKLSPHTVIDLGVEVINEHGVNVFTTGRLGSPPAAAGLLRSTCLIPGDLMNNGSYRVHVTVFLNGNAGVGYFEDLLAFELDDAPGGPRGNYNDFWPGAVRPAMEWKTEHLEPLPAPLAGEYKS